MSETRIRVLLADDHAVVRAGYRRVLENTANMQVVAEAGSGEEAYALVKKVPVHVVVMDLTMDGLGGLEALRRIRARVPKVKVLIFSMHVTAAFANQAFQSGAAGYV
ncbi:MAG: response regulator, partial [Burkholderiales bacterium]